MEGHYDRKANVAWIRFTGWSPERIAVEERPFGLVERDRETGEVLGLEFWRASEVLPPELLDALPAPPARQVAIERQPA